ncbi:hypothetical protein Rhal01_03128 [Rubritalea halochordaticola]|uniref:Uncharacterized protein n=2 Tax=Rubritalea halochordaticola TaxID=714537 RepID=A0ABP9V4M7_9BACT
MDKGACRHPELMKINLCKLIHRLRLRSMKSFMYVVIALFSVILISCERTKNSGLKTWGELPIAHSFSDKLEDGADLSDEMVLKVVFEEEIAKEGLDRGGEAFFVRGVLWTEQERVYHTWLCRVPVQGNFEFMLEYKTHVP